jgi:serine/threonine protein kinase
MEPDKENKEAEKEKKEAEPSTARRKVTIEDFSLKHRLGKGAYGDVFLVIKNSDHKAYALKQIQKRKLEREQKEYQALV